MRRLAHDNAAEIASRYPNIMRRVSGYNLDEFVPPLSPTGGRGGEGGFNLAKMVVGSEGTLCVATEVKVTWCPAPR